MKKLWAALLTLSLLLFGLSAVAAENPDETDGTIDMPSIGLRFAPPEEFRNTNGQVTTDGAIPLGLNVYLACWYYRAVTENGPDAPDSSPEASATAPTTDLFYVFAVGNGMDLETLNSTRLNSFMDLEHVREIGQAGSYTYYLYMMSFPDFASGLSAPYAEEYTYLSGLTDQVAAAFTCYEPLPSGLAGTKVEFTTTDLDGKPVSSADLFAQNEITLVNIWATWCGPCIGELAELQQLHLRFRDNGCGVVGLLDDRDLKSARQLVTVFGVEYPVIVAPDNLDDLFPFDAYPSSFFISRDGVILADPIVGAYLEDYELLMDTLLQE